MSEESAVEVSTLHEELSAVYDQMEPETKAPETVGDVEGTVEPVGEEIDLSESELPLEEETVLTAPEHWSADRKDIFSELTPAAQQVWLDREQEFERGIQEKSQDAAQYRQQVERYEEVVGPLRSQLQLMGQDENQWLRQMAGYTQALTQDPVAVIQAVANQYGVDLKALTGQESDEFVDPQSKQLMDRINSLEQQIQERDQATQQQVTHSQTQAIESFRSETDAEGNPTHPHFDAVVQDITVLAQGYVAQGQKPPELQALYDKAVLMRPELTAEDQQKAQEEAERKAREGKAKAAKRARSAGAGAKSSVADGGETKSGSLRDELNKQYDAQVGGS